MDAERQRIGGTDRQRWLAWGPYLSERQWGTVREDYSASGDAWNYLPHDHARSRAYRWGEDGILGICDDQQRLCFALALWNGKDPILKERYFGLTNAEGNHGEDVKEYWFYEDATPSASYLRGVYKYPQAAFPYSDLVAENARRQQWPSSFEYELMDTGVFDQGHWDVRVEYAKRAPGDTLIRLEITNRGPAAAQLCLLPTLWWRNTWSWEPGSEKPQIVQGSLPAGGSGVRLQASGASGLPSMSLLGPQPDELLFADNESNAERLWGAQSTTPYPKDAINDYIVNPSGADRSAKIARSGPRTKASLVYRLQLAPGETRVLELRLVEDSLVTQQTPASGQVFAARKQEADAFYAQLPLDQAPDSHKQILRQALAGMVWSKQYYRYCVSAWLDGDPGQPPPPAERQQGRNAKWRHFFASDVLSPPDGWEYPWGFANWDLCLQALPLTLLDPQFAKEQLQLIARDWYVNPNGQLPAYEWAFDDVNPPLHAWAAWRVYNMDAKMSGKPDRAFLQEIFQRSLVYFTWWTNRKDPGGDNLFSGGFLGLDNIGPFDRNRLPPGYQLFQSDATSWMGLFSLMMLRMALELAQTEPAYHELAFKFFQNFVLIADALNSFGDGTPEAQLWDEQDRFFYDVLEHPDGRTERVKVRSLVGLLPLLAVDSFPAELLDPDSGAFGERFQAFLKTHRAVISQVVDLTDAGPSAKVNTTAGRVLLYLVSPERAKSLLARMLDPNEFLGPYGIRSLSRYHEQNPYYMQLADQSFELRYAPAESVTRDFGGNSNWRGPVWFPINYLLIEALQRYDYVLGEDFRLERPGQTPQTLWQVASELSQRLIATFEPGADGRRPCYGGVTRLQEDPSWKDNILFFEYFHGDNGAGLGASHQTGWTSLVAKLITQQASWQGREPLRAASDAPASGQRAAAE